LAIAKSGILEGHDALHFPVNRRARLKAAEAFGLKLPPYLLARADELIETGSQCLLSGQSGHDLVQESAFAVAIECKADMPFCVANVCF